MELPGGGYDVLNRANLSRIPHLEWRMRAFDLKAMMLDDDLFWEKRESAMSLEDGEVQVWKASVAVGTAEMDGYRALLAPDELDRMSRMRAGVARDEFVVGRGLLRRLVGAALGTDPRGLVFETGRHGKPEIQGLEFNVSHSRGVILIALCRDSAVGVDVEWMDETIEALDIARQSFSEEEIGRIRMVPAGVARARAFYECWVSKEAVTKAHGAGLTLELGQFTVPEWASGETELEMGNGFCGNFFLRPLKLDGNFLAALALKKKAQVVRCLITGPSGI